MTDKIRTYIQFGLLIGILAVASISAFIMQNSSLPSPSSSPIDTTSPDYIPMLQIIEQNINGTIWYWAYNLEFVSTNRTLVENYVAHLP